MIDNEIDLLFDFLEEEHINKFYKHRIHSSAYSEEDNILVLSSTPTETSQSVISFWNMQKILQRSKNSEFKKKYYLEAEDYPPSANAHDETYWFIEIVKERKNLIAISTYSDVRIYDIKKSTISNPPILQTLSLFDSIGSHIYNRANSFILNFYCYTSSTGQEFILTSIGK